MHIEPFKVEIWMNEWENHCTYNLAETCVASITIQELLHISGRNSDDLSALLPMKMTYGAITGRCRYHSHPRHHRRQYTGPQIAGVAW